MRIKNLLSPEEYRRIVACTVKRPPKVIRVARGTYSGLGSYDEPGKLTDLQTTPFIPAPKARPKDWAWRT